MRTSETPRPRISSRRCATYARATAGALLAGARDRLGDDLDQRDAGAVVVDERVVRAVDAAGGAADVQRLAGVLLHVGALDLDAEGLAVDLDVGPALEGDRLVVLRGLEVLRHVRVEVVLPREPAPLRDLAVQRQPDPDRRLHRLAVDHRHRAGQARGRSGRSGCSARRRRSPGSRRTSWCWCSARRAPRGPSPGRTPRARRRTRAARPSSSGHRLVQLLGIEQRAAPLLLEQRLERRAHAVEPVVGHRRERAPGSRPAGRPRARARPAPRARGRRRGWPGWWRCR